MCLARAKVVNDLAVRQVKQGSETTRFRYRLNSTPVPICSYESLLIYKRNLFCARDASYVLINYRHSNQF